MHAGIVSAQGRLIAGCLRLGDNECECIPMNVEGNML